MELSATYSIALLEQPWRDNPRPRKEKPKKHGRCWERPSEGRETENTITEKWPQPCLTQWNKATPCGTTQDWWVMVERSDRMRCTGEGNGKPLQYSCLENPMNSVKRQKDRKLRDELPRSVGANILLEISGEITPERMKGWSQSKNNTQLWMWLVIEHLIL